MIKEGQVYKHFKGDLVKILMLATDSETLDDLVVYEHKNKIWVRPLKMFMSKVDRKKYPECKQAYRFELIND